MSIEQVARQVIDCWESHNLNKVLGILTDDFVLTGPAPQPLPKEAYAVFQSVNNEAFPDWSFNAGSAQVDGSRVTYPIRITATHTGVLDVSKLGIPVPPIAATGKTIQLPAEKLIFTVVGDKVTACHAEVGPHGGMVGILEQLGVQLGAH